jgi:hypothetical protein
MPRKVTSGALLWLFSEKYAVTPNTVITAPASAGLIQAAREVLEVELLMVMRPVASVRPL